MLLFVACIGYLDKRSPKRQELWRGVNNARRKLVLEGGGGLGGSHLAVVDKVGRDGAEADLAVRQ